MDLRVVTCTHLQLAILVSEAFAIRACAGNLEVERLGVRRPNARDLHSAIGNQRGVATWPSIGGCSCQTSELTQMTSMYSRHLAHMDTWHQVSESTTTDTY